jgi:hypothetical protein
VSFALRFLVLALGARAMASAPQPPRPARRVLPAEPSPEPESAAGSPMDAPPRLPPPEGLRSGRLALLQAAASTRIWSLGAGQPKPR